MSQAGVHNIPDAPANGRAAIGRFVRLKLQALGFTSETQDSHQGDLEHFASGLLANFRQKSRLLRHYRCPVDRRIEAFLAELFEPRLANGPGTGRKRRMIYTVFLPAPEA